MKQSKMHSPQHPGAILRELYMKPLKLSLVKLSRALKVSTYEITRIADGFIQIDSYMAVRLSICFGTSPELWLNLQHQYNLWQAKNECDITDVEVLHPRIEE